MFITGWGDNLKRLTDRGTISGVNFTNILRAAFMHADPNSAKKKLFFALLGSACVKAAHNMLMI